MDPHCGDLAAGPLFAFFCLAGLALLSWKKVWGEEVVVDDFCSLDIEPPLIDPTRGSDDAAGSLSLFSRASLVPQVFYHASSRGVGGSGRKHGMRY